MTNDPAIIEAAARDLNDELTIIRSAIDGVEDIPDARAALQRCAWIVDALLNYAQWRGARAGWATLARMVEERRGHTGRL